MNVPSSTHPSVYNDLKPPISPSELLNHSPNFKREDLNESIVSTLLVLFPLFGKYVKIQKSDKVLEYQPAVYLQKILEEQGAFSFEDNHKTQSVSENSPQKLKQLVSLYLKHCVKTHHPQYFNQLWSGVDLSSIVAELLMSFANTSGYTYEVAPVASVIENSLIKQLTQKFGYKNGDGIFTTGGSHANLLSVNLALQKAYTHFKTEGIFAAIKNPPKIFVSEAAHYSFIKSAVICGMGTNCVTTVTTNSDGSMNIDDLNLKMESAVKSGNKPVMIVSTASTTLLGSFDDLGSMAKIAKKHDCWLHIDAAFGGGVIFSERHGHLLSGSELADSITWDPHKILGISLTCSMLLTQSNSVLGEAFDSAESSKDYLFHETEDAQFDIGKKSIFCGRRTEAVKLWLYWNVHKTSGINQRIDRLFQLAEYAEKTVVTHPDLELAAPRSSLQICFRYKSNNKVTDENNLQKEIREHLYKQGLTHINHGVFKSKRFIRLVLTNPNTTEADIDTCLNNIIDAGRFIENHA